ncbi:hypothetical protein DNTS_030148 [Danionella cerebrum]|uniref:Sugar phosphate transporter domain-containing protein n=1 Tax=Danionella cerebrum TaxID=2873325 RepID=A0A553QNP9_9TELE|nr:hypothetical protein DNTS_030148 [Danionella translucida]
MAEDKDPVTRLKDLAQLRDQLEEIQRKVETEVQAGVPQFFIQEEASEAVPFILCTQFEGNIGVELTGSSILASPFLKGFLAGYVVSRLRSSAILGSIEINKEIVRMIAVKDGYSKPRLQRIRWLLLLLFLVFIYGSHAPLISLTKIDGQVPFSASSCVVLIELTKLLFSVASLLASGHWSTLKKSVSILNMAPYSIPAALYTFNNNLVVFMQSYMDPSSFQVLSNLKILSTALLYSSCLGRHLHGRQWLALGLLVAAGIFHSAFSLSWGAPDESSSGGLHVSSWGFLCMFLYCLVSGLAAVYTEHVLKTQCLPLSIQNLFLYAFGVGINLGSHLWSGGQQGFFEGYSELVWIIIAGQAANGLLMSVVMKHGTGITRLFVISSAMLVNAVLSWGLLGLQLTPYFLFPVVLIGVAVYLYYS